MPGRPVVDWQDRVRRHAEAQGDRLAADVIDELATHLADIYESEQERGRSDAEARLAALHVLDRARYAEIVQRARSTTSPSTLLDRAPARARFWAGIGFDLRYAARTMRGHVALSLAVVVILAAGIGATTAVYAVIRSVLLRPLPYPDSSRLVALKHVTPTEEGRSFAAADFVDYASRHEPSLAIAAYASWPMNLTAVAEPERLRSIIVSGDFFAVAGTPPLVGRVTTRADDTPSAPAVVVVSHGFWIRRFGGDPGAIGQALVLNGRPAVVVGVMPPAFALPTAAVDLWMPMGLAPEVLADRAGEWLSLVGRLKAGRTLREVQADVAVTAAQLASRFPRTNANERAVIRPLLDEVVGGVRRPLWLGAAAALFVLLAGCANAANLMLARTTLRRDEMAIRAALGAAPLRLARQLLVESGLLASVGGALGVGAAWIFLRAFVLLAGSRVPRIGDLRLDATAVAVAAVLAIATTWIFGGAAAWLLVRTQAGGGRIAEPSRHTRSSRLGTALLAGQVAFAMLLAVGAAAVVRGYASTLRIDPGFDVSDTTTVQLTLPRGRYADDAAHVRFAERTLAAIAELPGVGSAGVVSDLPFVGNATRFGVVAVGEPAESSRLTTIRLVDPGFFRTLRVPLVHGRFVEAGDRVGSAAVAVLNRTAAERFGGAAALGRQLRVSDQPARTIVGIVGDIKHAGLRASEGAVVYVPYAQKTFPFINWMGIVARTDGTAVSAASLKAVVAGIDPMQPVQAVQTMRDYVDEQTAPYRFSSLVVGSLAAIALVLAITGMYGLTAFVVGRRTRELGVRLALGATRADVVLLIIRQMLTTLAVGVGIGAAGSLMANDAVQKAIGETGGGGGVELAVAIVILAGTAIAAALGPALRAARIDPRAALNAE